MGNKIKGVKDEEKSTKELLTKLDAHHQAEKDKIMADHRKQEIKNVRKTLIFLIVVVVVAIGFLSFSGVLDNKTGEATSRADTICFLSGHPGGVDTEKVQRNGTSYIFECSNDNITMLYDIKENKGLIEWNE